MGNGVIHLQKSQAAGSYGSNYGLFVSADGSQLKEVSRRAEIDVIGIMCTEGIIKGNENGGFVCMDETARKMLPYNKEYELKEGKYPEKMQEIAAGRAFFRAMGYDDVKVGDTVTLDYHAGMRSEYKPEEFVVEARPIHRRGAVEQGKERRLVGISGALRQCLPDRKSVV